MCSEDKYIQQQDFLSMNGLFPGVICKVSTWCVGFKQLKASVVESPQNSHFAKSMSTITTYTQGYLHYILGV